MVHPSAEKNIFKFILTLSFCSLLFYVIWVDDREIPEVRYCCRMNSTCIDKDVISASDIFADGNSSHSFNVIRRKPCFQLIEGDDFINTEVSHSL